MRKNKPKKNKLGKQLPPVRNPDEAFVPLGHTKLERRRLLNADFSFDNSDLLLHHFVDSDPGSPDKIDISQDADHYIFNLHDGVFHGTDTAEIVGNDTSTLMVDKSVAGLVKIILDSNSTGQFDIEFGDFNFGGALEVSHTSGPTPFNSVSQADGTSLASSGSLSITGALDIHLDNLGNDFNLIDIEFANVVSIHDQNSITIDGLVTNNGSQVTAGGSIHVQGAAVNSWTGSVSLMATGETGDVDIDATISAADEILITSNHDILFSDLGLVTSSSSTTIELSAGGSILDHNAAEDANIVAHTGIVRLNAHDGIGSGLDDGDIDIDVSDLQFDTDGAIHLTDLDGGLAISEASRADGGGAIAAESPLTISADITVGASASFTAGDSASNNDDLTINNNATVTLNGVGQVLTFTAGDDIIFDTGMIVTAGTGNTVILTADHDGAVDLDRGSITNKTGLPDSITTNKLRLSAADGIGDSAGDSGTFADQALRIKADILHATNSTNHKILVSEFDSLVVDTLDVGGTVGITNNNNDVKLSVGGNLAINKAIDAGIGNLFLNVDGNITQSDSITAAGLGLMVNGTTRLQNAANDVNIIAANTQNFVYFTDVDDLTVGSITVDGMNLTGITSSNDSTKLMAGGDIAINAAVNTGNLLLVTTGNVTQTAAINAVRLGLMVDGNTTLQNGANDVAILAANNGGTTLYTDANSLTISEFTVDGMTVTGITTTNDDVKLIAGGNLAINSAINLGTGDLFLAVTAGSVSQTAAIKADGLGLMVSGVTTLKNPANDVNTLASEGGRVLFNDLDELAVGTVTVDGMTVTGLKSILDDVKLTTGGNLAINSAIDLGIGDLFLDVAGNVTQTASIKADRLGLMVDGFTRLQNAANDVNIIAANTQNFVYFTDVDDLTVGSITVDGMNLTGITSSNDSTKLMAGGDIAINAAVNTGNLLLVTTGNVTQTAAINAVRLGLMVDGNTTLQNGANDVAILAANNGGTTLYTDANSLTISEFTVDGMTVTGITTTNDDVKLIAGGNLAINSAIDLGTGDLFLAVTAGSVSQTAAIKADGLGLMVSGVTTLKNPANDVNTLASEGGRVLFNDLDELAVGTVTVDGMTVTGLKSILDDVKLTTGGNLAINSAIDLGIGDLFLDVAGNVTQTASIKADRLGLMVDGFTRLQNAANDVNIIAANTQNFVYFTDVDDLTVGSITVDGMNLTGITSSNDSTKLMAGGDIAINAAVNTGNLLLVTTGNVTQTAAINAVRLGLMVDGNTTLQNGANDVAILAANNGGTTLYTDANSLTISEFTVDGMTVTGITTTNDDVKLIAGGNLAINSAIDLGTGDLFLAVTAGSVSQTAAIKADGLGLMVSGVTTLKNPANDVNTLASEGGRVLFNDLDELAVGTVTVDGMTVTGLKSILDDVKLTTGGNLAINSAIDLGIGDLFLDVAGNVTQTASIKADRLGLMVDGFTRLQNAANDVNIIAANTQNFVYFTDVDDLTVGSITVDGMNLTGITSSNDSTKLMAGGDIAINAAVNTGNLLLVTTGNVTQTAAINAVRLGLMVDGNTTLQNGANDVAILAANNGGTTLYTDANSLTISEFTVDGMTVTGITTTNDDVKLIAGGNLAINSAINLGTGDLFLAVTAGSVSQTAAIKADGLGLMVSGVTTLKNPANDVNTLASEGGRVLFNDLDELAVGTVTVDGMTVTGLKSILDDVKLTTGGNLAINSAIDLGIGDLFLDVAGNVTQTASIKADRLGLMVDGFTRLQNAANDVNIIAANTQNFVYFTDVDDLTVGSITVDGMNLTGITSSNDSTKLMAGGDIAINAAVNTGNLLLVTTGNVTQTAAINAVRLGLMVDGNTTLQNGANDVAILAANNGGTTLYTDANSLTISEFTVDGMTVTGITTTNDDVKLIAGGNLAINSAIDLGTGDLFLAVTAGSVSQTAAIKADGLGLMVSGVTTLKNPANDVNTLASEGGRVLFNDLDELAVGTVTVDGMTVTGLKSILDDVKLTTGGNLAINSAIDLGIGDLFLDVAGNVTQTASIKADRLGLMVDGFTRLQNAANDVNIIAANTQNFVYFTDVDDLTVGSITVDGMNLTGITSSNDSTKLMAGGDIAINAAVNTGNLLLVTTGNVTQTAAINAVRLGLMVDGNTTLQNGANDVAILAANNGGTTLYTDANSLTISEFTVDGMTVTGITTTNDDVKLIAGGNLAINSAINLGTGDLFLAVTAGSVSQTAAIKADGLGLMVSGVTTLKNPANDVNTLASEGGRVLFNDLDELAVGTVTVDGMTVTGLKSILDDVKLTTGGNLVINSAIDLGAGDLFLDVDGDVNQTAPGTITAAGLGLMVDGNTRLQLANDVDRLAASTGGTILFNDVDGLTVGTVTVLDGTADQMQLSGITTTNDDVKLIVGDTAGENLSIEQAINLGTGDLFLDVAGNVTQTTPGTITAAGLGLMVDGNTRLQLANDVDRLAASTGGTILFNDVDGLTVSTVTVLDGTADQMQLTGITTTNDDVKLIVGDAAGENLSIEQAINLGTGDLFLDVAGNVTQTAPGTIIAAGLGLMVDGNTRLQLANDVDRLAASTGGTILFNDVDGLTVSTVTVLDGTADQMLLSGITTTNDDVKLIVGDTAGENLSIEQAINLGTGDLFLDVAGNVTQTAPGTIIAAGLGLMVDGNTRLQLANDVDRLAASTGGTILFNDVDGLTVSTVTVLDGTADQMQLSGITTTNDDVKLIVGDTAGENLSIEQAINLGTGDLFLDVAGDVNQTAPGTITAAGLGLMVDGNTRLQLANDVDRLAASTGGTILFNDLDGLTVGTVTVLDGTADQMQLTGITTTNDDVKLIVGDTAGENLSIEQAINLGTGDLFLDVAGNVTQTAPGTIIAAGLGLMVDGNTRLQLANDVDRLAASTGGTILFNDVDGLTVSTVTVLDGTADQMLLSGITTTNDDVKLIVGDTAGENLSIEQAINLGTGDLFLDVAGNVTQTTPGTITAAGLGLMVDGNTRLQLANDVDRLAASTGGTILFNDVDGLTVSTVTVLDGTADQMQLTGITTTNDDVKLIVGDTAGENLSIEQAINLGTGDLFLDVAGDVNQTAPGTITASGLGLMVDGNTRLQLANDVDRLAASTGGTILFNDVDGLTVSTVTVLDGTADQMQLSGITTTNDDVKLIVGDTAGENLSIEQAINLGTGDLFLDVAGNVTQTAPGTIIAAGLGLMVDGNTRLQLANDVDRLAASTGGTILFNDVDGLTVSTVTVLDGTADQMQLTGITTTNDDVKLIVGDTAGENLSIEQAINLGTGDLFLDVAGNVTQTTPGTIIAAGLGLMVDGNTRLQLANDVDRLAASTGGTILFNDVDGLTVGTVTVLDGTADQMQLSGITTSNDDVKLIVGDAAGENLSIEQAINLGTGDLFLDVAGNVTQTTPGTITAAGLGLMVDGNTRLQLANDVDRLAASTGGTILFNDVDGLTVSTVTVLDGTADQMLLSGITTTNDDVKLIVGDTAGENLSIEQAINLGTGDLFLDVAGNVTQTTPGTITAAGLGLMVDGNTRLQLANDVDRLAASTGGTILFNDVDGLTVGTVTVLDGTADQMQLSGITTTNDDVKLIVGDTAGENLSIEQAINLGTGDLFLDVAGNVTQTAPGTIIAAGLGLMVDGNTRLQLANDVDRLAASTGGTILFNDVDGLTVSTVTVLDGTADQMQLTGITTTNDDVKLIVGDTAGENLSIEQAINLGTGDLFLDVAGDVNQTAPGTITASGLGLMVDGNTRLQLANDVDRLAASTGGTILFNDVDGLTVSTVTVLDGTADQMQLTGITTTNDDVKLIVGDTAGENLSIEQAINLGTGDLFLDVAGDVNQTAPGTITASGLGLMVDGNTRLQLANDVDRLAASTGGTILFNDVDGLTVSTVTVLDGTADQMQLTGITTTNDDVKLIVGDTAGENLSIEQAINLGTGDLFLDVAGNVTQTAPGTIIAAGLGLMVDGNTRLQLANDVDRLAASTGGTILFNDVDGLTVSTVTVLDGTADQMQLSGITTTNDDVKLIVGDTAGENLSIEQAINLGTGDLFLDVAGDVNQTAPGTITAAGLGLMVDGNTRLQLANDVDRLAASTGGTILFNDVDGLTVGTVTVLDGTADQMQLTGITTTNDNVKLIVGDTAGENLSIEQAIKLGTGNLFLDVAGNVTQTALGTITANGLGLMVDGLTTLQNPVNDINVLAADNESTTRYTDASGFTVGTVTAEGMTVKGANIVGDFILIAKGDISQDSNAPVIVSGLTDITTTGNVCWTFGDCFGPGNVPDGLNDNDLNELRIQSAVDADIVDSNQLTVSLATVNSQLRLAAGDSAAGQLLLTGNISATSQVLLQASAGVLQSGGIVTTDQLLMGGDLAKESTGNFVLQSDNVVNDVAARVVGDLRFTNVRDLNIGVLNYASDCGSTEALSGLDITGNLVIDVNTLLVADLGNLTQSDSAPVRVTGTTVLNTTGNIELLGDDRDPADGGNSNDFQGVVNVNDNVAFRNPNQNFVEIADINQLTIENANSNVGIQLFAGTTTTGSLELIGQVTTTNVLLQSSGGVNQDATNGVITGNELIVGGNQVAEGSGAFILQGSNQINLVAGNLLSGTFQLQNTNALTVSSGLSFTGSDGTVTDMATGLFAGGNGAMLAFADPNVALSATLQGTAGNVNSRFNPAFGQYLATDDVGIVILNQNTLTVETGALVNAVSSDIYLETVGANTLSISDTVRVDDVSNRILVVAGGNLVLEPNGRLERGSAGLITSRFNDIILQDPTGAPSDQNRLVDRNTLTQTLQFIFGDQFESNFDTTIFWGIEGKNDNSFDFGSLNPTQRAALETLLFGTGSGSGFESRSFYSTVTMGATSETLTSQPIGSTFDNSGTNSDAPAIPTASFTLDFLRNNAEFRNVVFVFNDANINMFQNASTGAIEDLNVATADFEGLARFNEPSRIAITKQEIETVSQIEVIPQTEFAVIGTTYRNEVPLFVQTVQQKYFIVLYFDSQAEADQFESRFGQDELDFEAVLKLLEELKLEDDRLDWRNFGDETENLDANQIREIIARAGLDLEDDAGWVERFKTWLRDKSDSENESPDVPRGVYKILEVDNGKTVIQGDDIDRRFVPEPERNDNSSGSPEGSDQPDDSESLPPVPPETNGFSTSLDRILPVTPDSQSGPVSRVERWSAMLQGDDVSHLAPVDGGNASVDAEARFDKFDSATMHPVRSSVAPLLGLLTALTRRKAKSSTEIEDEQGSLIEEKAEYRDRNIFSNAARFRRRLKRSN